MPFNSFISISTRQRWSLFFPISFRQGHLRHRVYRPAAVGSAIFDHFIDHSSCTSCKVTLVTLLLTVNTSTVVIGLLPDYETIGELAPLLLALACFGQDLDLGGEWGGAPQLATENTTANKRVLYGFFLPLSAPISFSFLCQQHVLTTSLAADR